MVILKSQFKIECFYIILYWRLFQTKNTIMQIFVLQILRVFNNLLKNSSLSSSINTVQLGVCNSRIYFSGWVLGVDSGFAPALDFYLLNTISNAWSSLYDPLHFIVLCYHPLLVPVTEMSTHYWCRYLMLDPYLIIEVANHIYRTQTKGLYIPSKVSVYSVNTSTVFNGVYTKQGNVD